MINKTRFLTWNLAYNFKIQTFDRICKEDKKYLCFHSYVQIIYLPIIFMLVTASPVSEEGETVVNQILPLILPDPYPNDLSSVHPKYWFAGSVSPEGHPVHPSTLVHNHDEPVSKITCSSVTSFDNENQRLP